MKLIKFLLYVLISVGLLVALYFGYDFYKQAKEEPIEAIYLIPENAAVVFQTNTIELFNSNIEKSSVFSIFRQSTTFDSAIVIVRELNSQLLQYSSGSILPKSVYYSLHFVGHKRFEGMISFSYSQAMHPVEILNQIIKRPSVRTRSFEGVDIYSVKMQDNSGLTHFAIVKGSIFFTQYAPLLEKLVLESNTDRTIKSQQNDQMVKIAAKDAPMSIYINHQYFYRLLGFFAKDEYINALKQLSGLAQFSVLDLTVDNQFVGLNGLSLSTDTSRTLLSYFQSYEPTKISMFEHLPASTVFMYYMGANKLNEILVEKSKSEFSAVNERAIKQYEADLLIDVRDYFYPWIKSEMAFFMLKTPTISKTPEGLAIMDTYDSKEALQLLSQLNRIASNAKNRPIDTLTYRTFDIHHIPLPYLLSNVFGKIYSPISETYYTSVNDYIIFGSSSQGIKQYIDFILIEKTLAKREAFQDFVDHISPESHLMMYVDMHAYDSDFKEFLSPEVISSLATSDFKPSNLGDCSIQFIQGEKGAYTSIAITNNEVEAQEEEISWQVALDYDFIKGPFIVPNHATNQNDIIVFDKQKMMYRISHNGDIMWSIPVAELPMQGIEIVDVFKNGKYQMMYNSVNYLYMYDLYGNKVENYPIALAQKATAGLQVVDYDRNQNYRVLVPVEDHTVLNFQIDGTEVKGWKKPKMPFLISNPIQYFRLGTKDFLLLSDTAGNVVFSNRRGETRIETKLAFTNNINTSFYKNGGKLATTDIAGRLILVDSDGGIEKYLLRDFTPKHQFMVMDVNGDGKQDYLFYDQSMLYVYDSDRNQIWMNSIGEFGMPIIKPIPMVLVDSTQLIIYNSTLAGFQFVKGNGLHENRNEFTAGEHFAVFKASKSNAIRMVSIKGRVVSNYLLK